MCISHSVAKRPILGHFYETVSLNQRYHCSLLQLWPRTIGRVTVKLRPSKKKTLAALKRKAKCFNPRNLSVWIFFRVLKGQIIKNQIYFKTFKFVFSDAFWIVYLFQSTLNKCHSAVTADLIILTKTLFYCSDSYESPVLLGYSQKRKYYIYTFAVFFS